MGLKHTWEIGRFSMITRRYVGKREDEIITEYEKLLSLLCFVNEFPKTKWRKYPQYTSEQGCVIMRNSNLSLFFGNSLTFSHIPPCFHAKPPDFPPLLGPVVIITGRE